MDTIDPLPLFQKKAGFEAPVYAVYGGDEGDRRQLSRDIVARLRRAAPSMETVWMAADETSIGHLANHLRSVDLFAKAQCFILDGIQGWSSQACAQLAEVLEGGISPIRMIILGESSKDKNLISRAPGYLLDLAKEKPWDRKRRYIQRMIHHAKTFEKSLSESNATKMIDYFGMNLIKLLSEVEKLAIQNRSGAAITFDPLQQSEEPFVKTWELVDAILEGRRRHSPLFIEIGDLYAILSQLRSRLYLALAIKEESSDYLKKVQMSDSLLNKYRRLFAGKNRSFFLQALKEVYEIDLLSRTVSLKGSDLLDLLIGRIRAHG